MADTIAKVIIDTLIKAGVKRIHGIVGDSINALVDEVRKSEEIEWINYRHEEAAAFAAGAEAQLTGKLAVCAGSSGPGNLHLINGLYDAHRSMAPVLAIAAHIPSSEIGTGYFQETHPELLFQECSHYCEVISSARQMPRVLQLAIQHAVGLSGVSVIALSGDVALEKVDNMGLAHNLFLANPLIRPADDELSKMASILNGDKKVTLLCGSGCKDAHDEVIALCEKLKAPVVYALRGKEHIEYENPFSVGMTGLIGYESGYRAMEDCEVLLMLGTDFPYKDFYPQHAQIIQVDLRAERLGRRTKVDLGLVGTIKETVKALLPLIETKTGDKHLQKSLKHYKATRETLDKRTHPDFDNPVIHPQYLTAQLSELASEDAIFTCDVGTPTVWAARYIHMTRTRRLLGSFTHGSMASAMPQAIGAQLTYPERQVIALCGDGGLSMLLGDILTIVQYKLPVKLVVYNNSSLGFVAMEMKVAGYVPFGTELINPDFAKMATAIGIKGIRVEKTDELAGAIAEALAFEGPVLLDVIINASELVMPPKIEFNQALGFSLYMAKQTLDGNGAEVIQTINENFIR